MNALSEPVVGICAVPERARWSFWDQPAHLVADSYLSSVQPQQEDYLCGPFHAARVLRGCGVAELEGSRPTMIWSRCARHHSELGLKTEMWEN